MLLGHRTEDWSEGLCESGFLTVDDGLEERQLFSAKHRHSQMPFAAKRGMRADDVESMYLLTMAVRRNVVTDSVIIEMIRWYKVLKAASRFNLFIRPDSIDTCLRSTLSF